MTLYAEKPTLITIELDVIPGSEGAFIDWQAKFNKKIISYPGFVSLEFLSPSEIRKSWFVVQRLANAQAASFWHDSEDLKSLKEELKAITVNNQIQEILSEESTLKEGATEVIVTLVEPKKENAYREWSAKIHQAEAKFPGFRGVYVQSPENGKGKHWLTLLQFDTMANLDNWLESPERRELMKESTPLISSLETHRMISPYSGWFASIAKAAEMPPAWKQTMIVLLVLFPIVMFELKYLSPLTAQFNSSIATFIGNAISVSLISFPMMPIAIYFLGWWLVPIRSKQRKSTLIGAFLICILYIIEIFLLWNFL